MQNLFLTWNTIESELKNIKCFGCFVCCCVMANIGSGGPGNSTESD